MKQFIKLISFLIIFLQLNFSFAQQQWTLQQCIEHAMKNNLQIRIAVLNNELNEANLKQSKANVLPNLNFGANNTYNFGKTIDRFTNQFANTRVQSINLGLQSQWNLFNGLQNYHTIKQNEINIMTGKYDIDRTKNDGTSTYATGSTTGGGITSKLTTLAPGTDALTDTKKNSTAADFSYTRWNVGIQYNL